jgi:hypothetical protein
LEGRNAELRSRELKERQESANLAYELINAFGLVRVGRGRSRNGDDGAVGEGSVAEGALDAAYGLVNGVSLESITLVEDNDAARLEDLANDNAFSGLGLDAFGGVDDESHDINDLGAA